MDSRRVLSPTGESLHPLEKKIYLELKGLKPLLSGQKVIVAVSGGLDSTTCLFILKKLEKRFNLSVVAVHVNHQTRGHESHRDQKFVEDICTSLNAELIVCALKGLSKDSSEDLMRKRRYEALQTAKKKSGAKYIFTAHHRDDLLETRVMRLLQGTGQFGLKSMDLINEEGVVRPFLNTWRTELKEFAKEKQIQWIEDSSNQDNSRLRNWIRNRLLRLLNEEKSQYTKSLFKSLDIIAGSQTPADPTANIVSRKSILAKKTESEQDRIIYEFLKGNTSGRVTSNHVHEFKKRIATKRKHFSFTLLKSNFLVQGDQVKAQQD